MRRFFLALAFLVPLSAAAGFEPGRRVLVDAHNCYPYQGRWADRIDRALSTGLPLAIEQDLVWHDGHSIVAHDPPFLGTEPDLEQYFVARVRPIIERAVRENKREEWPLIVLNLDFKSDEREHHQAIWNLLGKYEEFLCTARKTDDPLVLSPMRVGPVLVLGGENDAQERDFFDRAPVGGNLRVFGAVHSRGVAPDVSPLPPTNYRRWWNNPWKVVERVGPPNAGDWTREDDAQLRRLVKLAHDAGLWIRFYTLDGFDPADTSGGWFASYNFGSLDAARVRWIAAKNAGVDFIASDQYEQLASVVHGPPDIHLTGSLTRADYETLFERAFEVPPGTKRVEVALEYSGDDRKTVIDLGLRGPAGFRGWSGGGQQKIVVGPTFASYGYLPGPIEPGSWAVILGISNIREGSRDDYSIDIKLSDREEPSFPTLAKRPGWYVGDLHCHSGQSDGRAHAADGSRIKLPVHRVFDAARRAGLDFIALSDHNTSSHWTDVERLQPYYGDVLLLHAREVTTYNGHLNAFGEREFVDFRVSESHPLSRVVAELASKGAFVSINHPAAPDDERCMGCGWSNTTDEVMRSISGLEVVNGNDAEGPMSGWPVWAAMLNRGLHLIAVGGSDDHTADEIDDRAIGVPATVIYATELSEMALIEGLRRGRAYIRTRGKAGPAIEFFATAGDSRVEMGGTIPPNRPVRLEASVTGATGQKLVWIRNGVPLRTDVIGATPLTIAVTPNAGDWFSIVLRDDAGPTLYSNAIYASR